jgi:hypothetical protein
MEVRRGVLESASSFPPTLHYSAHLHPTPQLRAIQTPAPPPFGFARHFTPNGDVYFVAEAMPVATPVTPPPMDDDDGRLVVAPDVVGTVAVGGPTAGAPLPPSSPVAPLPYGWDVHLDPATNRPFFRFIETGHVQWEVPEANPPVPPPAAPYPSYYTVSPSPRQPTYSYGTYAAAPVSRQGSMTTSSPSTSTKSNTSQKAYPVPWHSATPPRRTSSMSSVR